MTIYGIATKFNTMMHTHTILLCTKFQDNWIVCLNFMTTFVVWQKEEKREKKTKKLSQFSKVHILETLGVI